MQICREAFGGTKQIGMKQRGDLVGEDLVVTYMDILVHCRPCKSRCANYEGFKRQSIEASGMFSQYASSEPGDRLC